MRPRNLEKEQAIKTTALKIIAEEGLEHLSMQKLAKAAGISPRTIYLKYADKEDLLVRLFIEEVLGAYEVAVLEQFDEGMDFAEGVQRIWMNTFHYFKNNKPSFMLMQYGTSSPLLNKAYQEKDIQQGQFFSPVHRFLEHQVRKAAIPDLPFDILRALMVKPLMGLMSEYFDHQDRPQQIITEEVVKMCSEMVIKGMLL